MSPPNQSRQTAVIFATLLLAISMILALLVALTHHQPVQAAPTSTNVSGPILTHTTWNLAGSPYILVGNVTVNPGITLTVEAGVTVERDGNYDLNVNGRLQAIGTPSNPITFTNVNQPQPDEWNGIYFMGGSSHLNHVVL
jgi:hypothetical protein